MNRIPPVAVVTICLSMVVFVGGFSIARAADTPWKAGVARVCVTPEEPIPMSGYAQRTAVFSSVEADLYVKALALEDAQGRKGVWITADIIGFRAAVADPICRQISKQTGLTRDQILLNASHTHAGPAFTVIGDENYDDPEKEEIKKRGDRYTKRFQKLVVDAAVDALANLRPARLTYAVGVAPFVMNRREFTDRGIILGVNPRGPVDRSVPMIRVDDEAGKLLAVVFGCACHNTTLGGDNLAICGDYSGFAQELVEKRHPDAVAMFVAGCAGDANPYPRGTMELARIHGRTLAEEVCRLLDEKKARPIDGPLMTTYKKVLLPLQPTPDAAELEKLRTGSGGWRQWVAGEIEKRIERGEKLPAEYSAPIMVWQFGDDLTLVAISGEVVVDYVALVEEALGPLNLWVSGYNNDVFGYLPSARVVKEGGYETRGLYAGGIGQFSEKAQDAVIEGVVELSGLAGRPAKE